MTSQNIPSDSALILGALFVACTTVCIGLFADPQQAARTVADYRAGLLAASAPVPPSKQKCLPVDESKGADVDTPCVDGCHYLVKGGSFPIAKANVTATAVYSDGTKTPGTVQFIEYGASQWTAMTCKGGAGSTLGGATGAGAYRGLAGLVGSEKGSLSIEQPSGQTTLSGSTQPISSALSNTNTNSGNLSPVFDYQTICQSNGTCVDYKYIGANGFQAQPGDQGFVGPVQSGASSGGGGAASALPNVPNYGPDLKTSNDWNSYNYGYFGTQPMGTINDLPPTDLPMPSSQVNSPNPQTLAPTAAGQVLDTVSPGNNTGESPSVAVTNANPTPPVFGGSAGSVDDKAHYTEAPNLNYIGDRYQLTGWYKPSAGTCALGDTACQVANCKTAVASFFQSALCW